MKIKKLNKKNIPIVTINNSLEKYKNEPLFQDKVDKANEVFVKLDFQRKKSE